MLNPLLNPPCRGQEIDTNSNLQYECTYPLGKCQFEGLDSGRKYDLRTFGSEAGPIFAGVEEGVSYSLNPCNGGSKDPSNTMCLDEMNRSLPYVELCGWSM